MQVKFPSRSALWFVNWSPEAAFLLPVRFHCCNLCTHLHEAGQIGEIQRLLLKVFTLTLIRYLDVPGHTEPIMDCEQHGRLQSAARHASCWR
jgi:hypothetical protein